MVDSSPSMDSSPKQSSLPCLGSKKPSTSYSMVLTTGSTMENPPLPETPSSSISRVLPPISTMKDRHFPSPHVVSLAGVTSILKANDSIKCNNGSSKGRHCSSISKLILNKAITHAKIGHKSLNLAVVAEAKGVLSSCPRTSTFAANLGNNGGPEDSSFVAPSKNILGKINGTAEQCDRSKKHCIGAHRPDQLHHVPFSSFGNVEKLASKGEAGPSVNFESQKVHLDKVSSLRNSELPHNKGISTTSSLVNKDANNGVGLMPPIVFEKSTISYSNVMKGAHHGPIIDIPTSRPMNLKLYQPFQSRNRKCVSPPLEVAEDGSKAWKNCLVGYFIEKNLPFSLVNNIAMRIWGNRGMLDVLANENGFYFFKFSHDEACSNVLEASPWLFAGRMVILKKWHPRLILSKDSYSKIPGRVKLYNIPYEYLNEEGLSHIASAVEKPLYADSLTESMKKISFARVCIEIDAYCNLVDSFDLFMGDSSNPNLGENIEILVEYQWKQKICTECKSFGHPIMTCPKLKPLHPPSENDYTPKIKQEWGRVNKRDAPLVNLPQE
ncbi:hypothetical protein Dsin_001756 [Dipteronia sinensis]|uniref:DUF4283 domain-containing protein n=1 Tax=Dipteronia sinensis TaxID=43782 RepID=A0AAE0B5V2_9ROSI|nr:hypothetical protein Dsin_001756 [Dipteronia sinensis]